MNEKEQQTVSEWKSAAVEPAPKDGSLILVRCGSNDFRILKLVWLDVHTGQPYPGDPPEWAELPK
jgi:hypothetical protein